MSLDYWRAAQSNLRAISLLPETVSEIPQWVYKLARARTAGYAFHLAEKGDFGGAVALIARLMREQPIYTALNLALIVRWQLGFPGRERRTRDMEVGRLFAEADPRTAPWGGHMILTRGQFRRLQEADLARENRKSRPFGRSPSIGGEDERREPAGSDRGRRAVS